MSAEKDITIDEKRVYTAKGGKTDLFVATGVGLARVSVSGDLVGEFGLEWRGDARDVAIHGGRVAIATPDDVLVNAGTGFEPTGFGPADALGVHEGLVAAGAGRIARLDGDGWTDTGAVEDVRAIDGDMVAAAGGIYRLDGTHVGLADAHDVSTVGVPLAATATGLYRLGNGWMKAREGDVRVVAASADGQAHAATRETLYERDGGEWVPVELPVAEPVAAVGYGEATYVVTEPGTVLVGRDGSWTSRSIGLPGVRAMAVTPA
jgi:hypothetical protein